jgi:Na+/phosphate symporter
MNMISDATKAITDKKAAVTVVFMDSTSQPLFQWVGTGALLTGLSHSPSDASSNGVLTITATIDADKWALCGPGSSDPLV